MVSFIRSFYKTVLLAKIQKKHVKHESTDSHNVQIEKERRRKRGEISLIPKTRNFRS